MKKITGGTAPAILWRKFMTAAHEIIQHEDLAIKLMEKAKYLNDFGISRFQKI